MKYMKVARLSEVDTELYLSDSFVNYVRDRYDDKCKPGVTRLALSSLLIVSAYNEFIDTLEPSNENP